MRDRINKCYKERGGTLTTATTIIVLFSSLSRRIKKTEIKKSFQKNQQQQQKKNSINRTDRPKARTVRRLEWRPMIDRVFDCATTTSTSILVPLFLVFFCLFFLVGKNWNLGVTGSTTEHIERQQHRGSSFLPYQVSISSNCIKIKA